MSIVQNARSNGIAAADNGDGTATYELVQTANTVMYDSAGQAIARDTGQKRFEFVLDYGGTPSEPSDDEVVEFGDALKYTGRSDDFCAATVPAIR